MQVLDSLVDGMMLLPDEEDQQHFAWALLRYLSTGEIPEGLSPVALAMFTANKPVLDNSRARSKAGASGGSKRAKKPEADAKQTNSKPSSKREANAKQTPNKAPSKTEANANQNPVFLPSEEEEEEEGKEVPPNGGTKKTRPRFVPPTLEEVKAYAEENGLQVDAERLVDYYRSNGWKVGRNPMRDWRATVRNWARKPSSWASGGGGDEYSDL